MPQAVQMVACHYANRSGRGRAAFFLAYEAAKEMVDARLAQWSKGAKYINLLKTEAELPRPQRSLAMGQSVMDGCVLGNENDLACRDAWIPNLPFAA